MLKKTLLIAATALTLAGCQDQASQGGAGGGNRSEIRIVGSSTVFPFAKAVAEKFTQADTSRTNPVLESTGTGGGMDQFCSGVGMNTPDITNASRRIKKSEFEKCQANGVTDIVEIQVGIDGIAIAQSIGGKEFKLSPAIVYKALAANPFGKANTAKNWSDIDPSLPNIAIAVFGPPPTSGTRDAFEELVMEAGCKTDAATKALKDSDKEKYEAICKELRTDGVYQEQGENDNLIVQKLVANPNMLGIFGYSYMEENADKVRGLAMDGIAPTYEAIAGGKYPGARPLYIYVKKAHMDKIPNMKEFIAEFMTGSADGGYLAKLGLISIAKDKRANVESIVSALTPLDGKDLK
ncbi:phosphate ABC transporter substrate-binding protein [Sphingorhabdus lutea]|uniref:Phosphate ABC transporter substrate-binding protein n=1 Tax=Sphingorhabdus lutea TaxID=1913578 RepID=A0A1L3JEN8_9SPHN|nr:substrate-binding domain-containing protein [Sphingorhabdus lutea]APG63584.1 phosphate ABC transporter substrate-binding protein [Sphingorhabdus lutea]